MGVRISLLLLNLKREKEMGYIKDSYKELVEKVSWPSFSSLQSSTLVVMVASLIFALIVLAMDMSFEGLMGVVYKFLGNL
ncbi:MAG: preprotein translocase subunit SecE [Alistipes sp.]|nr:preprotein translocase subunit SecE [Rikenellaceae bacterium]MBR1961680.1 preprotein translocase subunit SecE [Alistipes sp.]